jgi:hypothetical protein
MGTRAAKTNRLSQHVCQRTHLDRATTLAVSALSGYDRNTVEPVADPGGGDIDRQEHVRPEPEAPIGIPALGGAAGPKTTATVHPARKTNPPAAKRV